MEEDHDSGEAAILIPHLTLCAPVEGRREMR
jgi:hypothetical protein